MTPTLYLELESDEAFRSRPYKDTVGVWTNGFGNTHGVTAATPPVTMDQARSTLYDNVAKAVADLDRDLPWWRSLDDIRQDVMAELSFNMGIGRLETFQHALSAIQAHDWPEAATQLRQSKWNGQVGARATRLENMMLTGARS